MTAEVFEDQLCSTSLEVETLLASPTRDTAKLMDDVSDVYLMYHKPD
jgi:hypothetical protein